MAFERGWPLGPGFSNCSPVPAVGRKVVTEYVQERRRWKSSYFRGERGWHISLGIVVYCSWPTEKIFREKKDKHSNRRFATPSPWNLPGSGVRKTRSSAKKGECGLRKVEKDSGTIRSKEDPRKARGKKGKQESDPTSRGARVRRIKVQKRK